MTEANKKGYNIIFAFTVPLFLLGQAIASRSAKFTRWAITLFFTIYGSTIVLNETGDGYRHRQLVYDVYTNMSFQQFLYEITQMFMLEPTESSTQEPYKHIVSYITGGVLQMPGLFFTVIAFVYGYFFSGAMLKVFQNFFNIKKNWIFWAFALLFFLSKNIEGVNTVRTWTGLWVLFYGAIQYYDTRKWKYLFLMLCPPLIHIGYLALILPTIGVLLLGNRPVLYAAIFVLSSFVNILNPQSITEQISSTDLGKQKVGGYYLEEQTDTEDKLEVQNEESSNKWYLRLQKAGVHKWAMNILIYTLLFYRVYPRSLNQLEGNLFATGLLTLAFSNATWFLYAVSNRSYLIGMIFLLAAFLMFMQRSGFHLRLKGAKSPLKLGLGASIVAFIPYFVYNISTLLDYPSLFLFIAPFSVWFNADLNVSVKEFLQNLLPFLV